MEAALKAANDHNAIVYAVGSGDAEMGSVSREDLVALARRSGGKSFFIRRAKGLEEVFRAVIEDLRSQYVLAYRPPKGPAGVRRIRVEVSGLFRQVRHRRSYDYFDREE